MGRLRGRAMAVGLLMGVVVGVFGAVALGQVYVPQEPRYPDPPKAPEAPRAPEAPKAPEFAPPCIALDEVGLPVVVFRDGRLSSSPVAVDEEGWMLECEPDFPRVWRGLEVCGLSPSGRLRVVRKGCKPPAAVPPPAGKGRGK